MLIWMWMLCDLNSWFKCLIKNKCSQFGDIYQEEYFMNILKDDISIEKELPPHMKSLDAEAIGSKVYNLISDDVLEKTDCTCYNNVSKNSLHFRLQMQILQRRPHLLTILKLCFLFFWEMELFTSLDMEIDLVLIQCLLIFRS